MTIILNVLLLLVLVVRPALFVFIAMTILGAFMCVFEIFVKVIVVIVCAPFVLAALLFKRK